MDALLEVTALVVPPGTLTHLVQVNRLFQRHCHDVLTRPVEQAEIKVVLHDGVNYLKLVKIDELKLSWRGIARCYCVDSCTSASESCRAMPLLK